MACGTGVAAGALIAAAQGCAVSPVAMTTSGGVSLTVQLSGHPGEGTDVVLLKGPAHLVYKGELSAEAFA
jgi:diaminopimelate epimerase